MPNQCVHDNFVVTVHIIFFNEQNKVAYGTFWCCLSQFHSLALYFRDMTYNTIILSQGVNYDWHKHSGELRAPLKPVAREAQSCDAKVLRFQ